MNMDIIQSLKSITLFKDLNDEEIESISNEFELEQYPINSVTKLQVELDFPQQGDSEPSEVSSQQKDNSEQSEKSAQQDNDELPETSSQQEDNSEHSNVL